jgi:hypothetical protein
MFDYIMFANIDEDFNIAEQIEWEAAMREWEQNHRYEEM